MLKKRPVLTAALLTGLLGVAALLYVLLEPLPDFADGSLGQIQVGMSPAEVTSVIGRPPDAANAARAYWFDDRGTIAVHFDGNGQVRGAVIHGRRYSFLERLVRRVKI